MRTDVLEQDRTSPLRVFVVWAPNVPGDFRDAVDRRLLADARVTNFWDAEGIAEQWFAQHVKSEQVSWDAYFLFAPRSRWTTTPGTPVASGSPVFTARDALHDAL